jgi:homoserine kinase
MHVNIAVPATVANLGPGFDILAIALQLQNDVRCEQVPGEEVTIDPGPDAPAELRDAERNLVTRAFAHASRTMNATSLGAHFVCVNRIPMARGLGSSAAAALAGILAAVALHRAPWGADEVLNCAAELEGHRDNAAAALLGGLAICAPGAPSVQMNVPDELRCVLYVPAATLATEEARGVVPLQFSRADAIFNAARCALLVRALALPDYASLHHAMTDRWHQTARSALIPGAGALIDAALDAGAAGACLAGAGPSVMALTPLDPAPVVEAMEARALRENIAGRSMVLRVRNFGARVDVRA